MFKLKLLLDTKVWIIYTMTPFIHQNWDSITKQAFKYNATFCNENSINFNDKKSLAIFNIYLAKLILSEDK